MENFKATEYTLKCVATEREFEDTGWVLEDKECAEPSLVRAIYLRSSWSSRATTTVFIPSVTGCPSAVC